MFSLLQQMQEKDRSGDPLVTLSGVAAALDTLMGIIINLALDPSRAFDLVFGFSLLLGFPSYLLDRRLKKRFAFCLLAVFLFRWAVLSVGGLTPGPVDLSEWLEGLLLFPIEWPVGILLFLALALLQWSKLRRIPT